MLYYPGKSNRAEREGSMIVLTYFVGTLELPALSYFPTLSNFRKNMFDTVTKKGSVLFEKLAQITSDPFTASETTMYTFLRVIYRELIH